MDPLLALRYRLRSIRRDNVTLRELRAFQRDGANAHKPNTNSLLFRLIDVASRTYDLGFTAFGGPPVHFHILHRRFVEESNGFAPWVSEQTFQELFALGQALPGPASTKMLFCMALSHAGLIPAILCFLLWSIPGAAGMLLLAFGVGSIRTDLPGVVCALLSGLNASTVGIIALAATELASKAISNRLSRILVIGGACAGICYSALWYFPVIMVVGGSIMTAWEMVFSLAFRRARISLHERRSRRESTTSGVVLDVLPPSELASATQAVTRRGPAPPVTQTQNEQHARNEQIDATQESASGRSKAAMWTATAILASFFVSFIVIITLRGALAYIPRSYNLFANMYLAGTIIFGGGPVVIPLLREYVVEPGWVSSRDFLIGLAIIQAFPGPNFNFAVYLGALTVRESGGSLVLGAFLGYFGIFIPGLTLATGAQSLWAILRRRPSVKACLKGINATAVGLIFTAVYRLWEIGYLKPDNSSGQSLGSDPWWVVVAVLTFSGTAWFKVPPPASILAGGILGLLWYGSVGRQITA